MKRPGERTSWQERMEISQRAAAGQTDRQIAVVLGCSPWTVRKWRRRVERQGPNGAASAVGRPRRGALSTLPLELRTTIQQMREVHPGWGADTILATLRSEAAWQSEPLPSRSRVAAFLKEAGLTRRYQRHSELPQPLCPPQRAPHEEWQIDAQGVKRVAGVGCVCLITIIDVVSRLKVESYPSLARVQPAMEEYQLALRRAFLHYGLPQHISLDHGTVFYDNSNPSPYPTRLHLWLVALGVSVRFTRIRRPTDHAINERVHQTMTQQALLGQRWNDQRALWAGLDARRHVLNSYLPTSALQDQAPLQAYPSAAHSGRTYRPEWEESLLNMDHLFDYLAQGRWFRRVHSNGIFHLGGFGYYAGYLRASSDLQITFDPTHLRFVAQPADTVEPLFFPALGLTKADLMGELTQFLQLPAYQLALPLDLHSSRQLEYAALLTGTTS